MDKRKALLLGSYTHPKFHPLQGIDKQITHLLNDMFTVQCTENHKMLHESNLYPYELCIAYSDLWDERVSPRQTAGLLSYVSGGGGLLVIHNGVTLANRYELAQLIGARFDGHPPMEKLYFVPGRPITILRRALSRLCWTRSLTGSYSVRLRKNRAAAL